MDKTGIKDIEAMIENLSAGKVKAPPMRLEICAGAGDWLLQMAQNTMNKDEVWIALGAYFSTLLFYSAAY